eukprot:TRINITY_DN8057_c0_g2_i3.p1 TRINITY_DN8057_c0_g2~~TRINITY_DN8057_c0_g2_i3.p1  ORF type:complete len:103 (+),score=5.38 TRINITY_DN8057_c0_g2_i3:63-371(+)
MIMIFNVDWSTMSMIGPSIYCASSPHILGRGTWEILLVLAVTITCFTPQQPSSSAPRHLLRRCHASSSSSATRQNHDTAPTPGCFALSPPSSSPSLHRLLYL